MNALHRKTHGMFPWRKKYIRGKPLINKGDSAQEAKKTSKGDDLNSS